MGILKRFTILAIAIIWNVEPVNAQVENPCPQIEGNEVSFPAVDLDIFEIPNINSQKIGTIPASQTFSLSNLSAKYYDRICWYEVNYSTTNEAGWIGFKLDYNDSTSESLESEPTPNTIESEIIEPKTIENDSFSPTDSPVEEYIEPTTSPQFIPDATQTPEIINSSPSPTEDNNLQNSPVSENSDISDSDLIVGMILLLVILAIALAFIVFVIKTFIKIIVFLLSLLFKKPATIKTNLNLVKTKTSPKRTYHNSPKKIINSSLNNLNEGIVDIKKINNVTTIQNKKILSSPAGISSKAKSSNIKPKVNKPPELILESTKELTDQVNTQNIGLDLEKFIFNFNQGSKQFFEEQSHFHYLKPTDNVIHGLEGNLGMSNGAELEIVEMGQASYLGFEAEGKLWLIPNLKLSRWQRLLKNSAFFDVLGDSSKPMLVKPAQLELVSGDRRKLIAKGLFN